MRILLDRFEQQHSLDSFFFRPEFTNLDPRDQALTRELVGGVIRNLTLLDFYIQHLSNRSLDKLDPEVKWILRVGLFQLEFLRVPDYAAVNEAAGLCRQFRKRSAAPFVNAVLRGFLRSKPDIPVDNSAESLALRFSHPGWLVGRYLGRYGLERTVRILEGNNLPPEPVVWVNPFKGERESFLAALEGRGIKALPLEGLPSAAKIEARGFVQDPLYREGFCFFMDASSQRVAGLADLEGCRLLADFCSAPGGKSFILASRMDPGATLFCADIHPVRLGQVRSRAVQYDVRGLEYTIADMTESAPCRQGFDFILVDAPCSGLGTIRSNPDIRWGVTETDLGRFRERQLKILANAFHVLAHGRVLLYSTCSTEPEENEQVIETFLSREQEARLEGEYFRTVPNESGGDGFFAARIRRV